MASRQVLGRSPREQDAVIPPFHVTAEPYCVLCRATLSPREVVISFCKLPAVHGPPHVYIHVTRTTPWLSSSPLGPSFRAGSRIVEVCSRDVSSSLLYYDRKHPLFFVHPACWKTFRRLETPPLTFSRLHHIGELLQPISDCNYSNDDPGTPPLFVPFVCPSLIPNKETSLGSILSRVVRLPLELQVMILRRLPTSDLLPFVSVCPQTASLLTHVHRSGWAGKQLAHPFKESPPGNFKIRATTKSILGQAYLDRLWVARPGESTASLDFELQAPTVNISGIKYVLGKFGLQALGILYRDGSASPWLGKPNDGWHGRIYGSDLRFLQILQDDLKIIRVRFTRSIYELGKEMPISYPAGPLFDGDLDLKCHDRCAMLHTPDFNGQLLDYSKQSFCRYLPLAQGGVYAAGLTIYSDLYGTNGIAVHGSTPRSIGTARGHPMSFFFAPGETITSLCLATMGAFKSTRPGMAWHTSGPWFLIKTSNGRVCMFAPVHLAHAASPWYRLVPDGANNIVTGIFAHCPDPSSNFSDVGATFVPNLSPPPSLSPSSSGCPLPKNGVSTTMELKTSALLSFWPVCLTKRATFLSVAETLSHATRLQARWVGPHITGMAIYRPGGEIDILGRWDPLGHEGRVVDIYRWEQGPLRSVTFCFDSGPMAFFVTNIRVSIGDGGVGPMPGGQSTIVARPGGPPCHYYYTWRREDDQWHPNGVVWACSDAHDEIRPWGGERAAVITNDGLQKPAWAYGRASW